MKPWEQSAKNLFRSQDQVRKYGRRKSISTPEGKTVLVGIVIGTAMDADFIVIDVFDPILRNSRYRINCQ